jgi:hypothetical protein
MDAEYKDVTTSWICSDGETGALKKRMILNWSFREMDYKDGR